LSEGENYDALVFYRERQDDLPLDHNGVEVDYLLKLSRAASDLGLGKLASNLSKAYREASGTSTQMVRTIAAAPVPNAKDSEARLVHAEQYFTEAKALWIASGMAEKDKIRERLDRIVEESPYSFEREIILGLMDEKEEAPASALKHAMRAQLLAPSEAALRKKLGLQDGRLDYWVMKLQGKAGSKKIALEMSRSLLAKLEREANPKQEIREIASQAEAPSSAKSVAEILGLPSIPESEEISFFQAEILQGQSRWIGAARIYQELVEKKRAGLRAEYELARVLLKTGTKADAVRAYEILERLAALAPPKKKPGQAAASGTNPVPSPSVAVSAREMEKKKSEEFWANLAREALENEKTRQALEQGSARGV
jgi:hypothetical protein